MSTLDSRYKTKNNIIRTWNNRYKAGNNIIRT